MNNFVCDGGIFIRVHFQSIFQMSSVSGITADAERLAGNSQTVSQKPQSTSVAC